MVPGLRLRGSGSLRARFSCPTRTARTPMAYKVATDFISRYTEAYDAAPDIFAATRTMHSSW